RDEQAADGGGSDALAEGRDDTTCDEEESGVAWREIAQLTPPIESSRSGSGTRSGGAQELPGVAIGSLVAVRAPQHAHDLGDQLVPVDALDRRGGLAGGDGHLGAQ